MPALVTLEQRPVPAATFAECPRCGGWARRMTEPRAARRWHCRGCRWSGHLIAADA